MRNLLQVFHIDDKNIRMRKEFVQIGEAERRFLLKLIPWSKRVSHQFAVEFYDYQFAFEGTRKFLEAYAASKEMDVHSLRNRLQTVQADYFEGLFAGANSGWAKDYFNHRLYIGILHNDINLPLKWYIGSYSYYQQLIRKFLRHSFPWRPFFREKAIAIIERVLFLDMQLISDAFFLNLLDTLAVDPKSLEVAYGEDYADNYSTIKKLVGDLIEQISLISNGRLRELQVTQKIPGKLGDAVTQMGKILHNLLSQIQEVSHKLGISANEILSASNEHEKIILRQTASINQIASTIPKLGQVQTSITENTDGVGQLLQETIAVTGQGKKSVDGVVGNLDEIRNKSTNMSERIVRLSDKIHKISKIVTTIREVTEQVNLLALNAAIEAARAGEHGKGFAIVAREVRRLAERTERFTAEISDLVEDVQMSTNAVVASNEENLDSVIAGANKIEETSSVFSTMHERIEQLVDAVGEIILAIRQQDSAFSEINIAIKEINSGMKETQLSTAQNVEAARRLNATAQTLQEQARHFQTDGPHECQ